MKGFIASNLVETSFETRLSQRRYAIDLGLEFIDLNHILKLGLPLNLSNSRLKLAGQDLGSDFTIDSLQLQTETVDIFKNQLSNLNLKANYQNDLLKLDYDLKDTSLTLTASNYIDFGGGNIERQHFFTKFRLAGVRIARPTAQNTR